jgi:hypothetical protein
MVENIKIKARLKKCSSYPHSDPENIAYNKIIEVDFIEWYEYGGEIRHIAGLSDDYETYHCWDSKDVEIIQCETEW